MLLRSILFLTLFGFLSTANPSAGQAAAVPSNEPVIKIDQAQFPPPPQCGLYDTCKAGKKG